MIRSPAAEEEGEDAGAGCRGRPRYAVGSEVEVLLTEKGFRGARFEATVAARLPGSGGYEVVFSTLFARRRGPWLREVVAAADVRPRPPPTPPGREIKLFDLVEAYNNDGWWPGVVSGIRPKRRRKQEARYAVSFPLFREVLELSASLVRPRREFVCGRWMDAQDVVSGFEGSSVEVMCDEEKKGRAWMPATTIKMVGSINYVVSYGNREGFIEVLHSRFIRPQPVFEKTMFEHELLPSAEVEVYQDGIWSVGIIQDVCSCEPRRYKVRVKHRGSKDEDDYFLVSSTSLRPYAKWNGQELRPCSTKDVMDMETISKKEATEVKQLESERMGLEFSAAKGKDQILAAQCDGKGSRFLPKALARKRKEFHSVSPLDDIVKTGSKSNYFDVVVISDDSGYGNFVEISDTSSSNSNIKKRRMYLPDKELHFNHSVHQYQAPKSASNSSQAQDHRHDLSLEVTRYSEEQARNLVLSDSLFPLQSSQDPSHKDGGQLIPLPEPELSDHLHLETAMMSFGDSAAGNEPHKMCQKVTELAASSMFCRYRANQKIVNQSCGGAFPIEKLEPCSSVQQDANSHLLCIEAPNNNKMEIKTERSGMPPKEEASFTDGKLEQSSSGQQDAKVDLLCIEAPNDNKMEIKTERPAIYPKEDAALPIVILEPSLTGQQDVKADLLCIQAPNDNKMEIKNERTGMSLEAAEGFHLKTCMNSFMPLPMPSSSTLAHVFSTSSLLLIPAHKMEIFERLPHIPHFREVQNCPPEFREGKALGLMVSFANMAESIKNMQIQDESQFYQEKMSSLLDLEDNGFEVGPLKVRLHNLLCTRNRQINLKNRKASLEKEILELEAINCGLEQQVKFLDMCIMGMEEQKYQEMKAIVDTQKAANCSSISKLQVDLCQVEESLASAEADFCSIAAAPWQSDVGSSLS
ncbi:hypothetical protein BAE44_0009616 [Dichanthelium oligosanthes]|uniref:Agenet domain-containing protein n=1 Tax=Dichanthelium oligosanthes TaxID=888268 RepID=A0A1E5VW83_9POAL|nr:hypothetical protein BAE44_0009616 [Dichanthelium oligosanthes]